MSQSVTDYEPVDVTAPFEEVEAVAAELFGTPEGRQDPYPLMVKAGAVFDLIGAVLCIVGVAVMARLVGVTG